jgi:YceI-like domain
MLKGEIVATFVFHWIILFSVAKLSFMNYVRRLRLLHSPGGYSFIGAAVFLCAFTIIPSAVVIRFVPGAASADIKVLGTSNLHNWSMEDKAVACSAKFTYADGKAVPVSLAALTFSFPVHSLKSGESGMDSKAYGAMKAKTGGDIVYTASASTITPGAAHQFSVKSSGNLTIAGVTKPVVLMAACSVLADGSITCTGTDKLLMTDYQIKPPTYMLGALKTGNVLTIDFTMVVQK